MWLPLLFCRTAWRTLLSVLRKPSSWKVTSPFPDGLGTGDPAGGMSFRAWGHSRQTGGSRGGAICWPQPQASQNSRALRWWDLILAFGGRGCVMSWLEPSLQQEVFGWPPYAPQSYNRGLSSPGAVEGKFRLLDLWLYPVFGFHKCSWRPSHTG